MSISTEEKYILQYIKEIINNSKNGKAIINNARYHHNTAYYNASSICIHGILNLKKLNKLGIQNHSIEDLKKLSDTESHINGTTAISLSVTGLKDLYIDEFEYDPYVPDQIDFLISSEIQAIRTTTNYGNEFLSFKSININEIKSIDIRLLTLIEIAQLNKLPKSISIQNLIEKYNNLKEIALTLKKYNINIPIREMSYQENSLIDINKIITAPHLTLKKVL